jgi:predicted permease
MIVREFRGAWRRLVKRPGYTVLSIGVLGVGLGVVLFLFSLINTVVLQPLPFPQAGRLMAIGEAHDDGDGIGDIDTDEYIGLYHLQGMDAVGAYVQAGLGLDTGSGARFYDGTQLTASMFHMLGAKPILGRGLVAADERMGAPAVVLIGENLWRRQFHADHGILGRKVRVSGQWATIVGVLPDTFTFRDASQLWMPLQLDAGMRSDVYMVARLAPGVTLAQARQQLDALDTHLRRTSPEWRRQQQIVMQPLIRAMTDQDTVRWVWLMFGAGALVLLLACVNVGNLQLVQTLNRQRELALRSALGCGRTRLFIGALVESLILSAAALAVALPIVHFGNRWLVGIYAAHGKSPDAWMRFGIDGRVLVFGAGMALLSTALAGLVSAWRASRTDLQSTLRDGGKGSGGGFVRVAKGLVVAEVALTVILLVGAGTFVRALDSLLSQQSVGAGHAAQVLTARLALPPEAYADGAKRIRFINNVVMSLRSEPGVLDATASNTIPGAVLGSHEHVSRPGRPEPANGWPWVQMGVVDGHFLGTYDVRLLKGRTFGARDQADTAPVVVIDQRMAQALWPDGDALQQSLTLYPGKTYARTVTVIGIVQTLQLDSRLEEALPAMLMPLSQAAEQGPLHSVGLAVRTHADATDFAQRLARVVHALDPDVAVFAAHTQARAMAMTRIGIIVLTDVFSALGLVALLLAGAGLYGVLAFSVAQRTQEIGIRRALGADSGAIMRTVGRQLAWQLGLGMAIGIALALPWSNLLADPNLRTRPHDPAVFIPVLLLVMGVTILASLVPLVRALRIDPAIALRYE